MSEIRFTVLRNLTLNFLFSPPFPELSFYFGSVSADSSHWLPILKGLLENYHALLPVQVTG